MEVVSGTSCVKYLPERYFLRISLHNIVKGNIASPAMPTGEVQQIWIVFASVFAKADYFQRSCG